MKTSLRKSRLYDTCSIEIKRMLTESAAYIGKCIDWIQVVILDLYVYVVTFELLFPSRRRLSELAGTGLGAPDVRLMCGTRLLTLTYHISLRFLDHKVVWNRRNSPINFVSRRSVETRTSADH